MAGFTADIWPTTNVVLGWLTLREGGLSENWKTGFVLFIAGLLGALFAVFLSEPGHLRGFGGAQQNRELRHEIAENKQEFSRGMADRLRLISDEPDGQKLRAVERMCRDLENARRNLERTLAESRRWAFLIGVPIFVLFGGVFAAVLATTLPQAFFLGVLGPAGFRVVGLINEKRHVQQVAERDMAEIGRDIARYEERLRKAEDRIADYKSAVTLLAKPKAPNGPEGSGKE